MNINKVLSNPTSKANLTKNIRKAQIPLQDGKNAQISLSDNYFECLITKGNKVLGGQGMYSADGVKSDKVIGVLDKVKDNVKDGVDFFKEFAKAILS